MQPMLCNEILSQNGLKPKKCQNLTYLSAPLSLFRGPLGTVNYGAIVRLWIRGSDECEEQEYDLKYCQIRR